MRSIAFALAALCAAPALAQDDLVERGKTVSREQCTRCHVVGDINPMGGISSTPSFQMIVNYIPDWNIRFETFHARPPHAAIVRFEGDPVDETRVLSTIEILIALEDLEAISAFAGTLKE